MLNIKDIKITVSIINIEDSVPQVCKGGWYMSTSCRTSKGSPQGHYFSWSLPPHSPSVQDPDDILVLSRDMVRWPGMIPGRWMNPLTLTHRSTQPPEISPLPCWFQLPLHPPPSKHTKEAHNFSKRLRKACRSACLWKEHEKPKVQTELLSNPKQGDRQDKVGWRRVRVHSPAL